MRYTCANCDHVFESDDAKPRCPQCLRRHGLLALEGDEAPAAARARARAAEATGGDATAADGPSAPSPHRRPPRVWVVAGAAVALIALAVGGYLIYRHVRRPAGERLPETVGLGPVQAKVLRKLAERRGVPLPEVPFAITPRIARAGKAIAQQGGARGAEAVLRRILERVRTGLKLPPGVTASPQAARPRPPADAAPRPRGDATTRPRARAHGSQPTARPQGPDGPRRTAPGPATSRPTGPQPRRADALRATAPVHRRGWIALRPAGRLKPGPLLSASRLLDAIDAKRPVAVVSYELACLTLALARAAGLPAVMVEIHTLPNPKRSADPSGYVGYFGVAVYGRADYQGQPTWVADPAAGTVNAVTEFDTLTDLRAAAHGLALRALYTLKSLGDPAQANELSQGAVRLAPRAATIQAARGMFLIATGGLEPGLDAMRSARALREDAPRHYAVALAHLAKRDVTRALASLDQAIGNDGHHALALTTKALVRLGQGKIAEATQLLDRAQRIAPRLPEALTARANLLLMKGEKDRALALLRLAIRTDPLSEEARFHLWRVLYVSGDEEEAEAVAKRWLAQVPERLRARTREQLEAFKKSFQAFKARQAPATPPAGPAGGDPFKLKLPGATAPSAPGAPATPFGKPPGSEPMLHL